MDERIEEHILDSASEIVARLLWSLNEIRINTEKPYKLASGNYSPIYVNCRAVISNPVLMDFFLASARLIIQRKNIQVDLIAGGETAGIPYAAYLAKHLSIPMIYVRKKEKEHGISGKIEGSMSKGAKVLLVEDLITDAGSKLDFVESIKAAGGRVKDILVLFDREQGGRETLNERGIYLHTISNIKVALKIGKNIGLISKDDLSSIRKYLANPKRWHYQRGYEFHV